MSLRRYTVPLLLEFSLQKPNLPASFFDDFVEHLHDFVPSVPANQAFGSNGKATN